MRRLCAGKPSLVTQSRSPRLKRVHTPVIGIRRIDDIKEASDANSTSRLPTVGPSPGGVFHRHGPYRSLVSGRRSLSRRRQPRHLRARRAHGVAHASVWPDAHRDLRPRPRAALGWTGQKHPSGRRGLARTRREALARRVCDVGHEPYRDSGIARRQPGHMDGTGDG